MKFIDEKGRFFGRVNIVDFFIVVLLVLIIPGFFCIYKVLGRHPSWIPSHWVRVEAVTFTMPEIAELIKPGQVATGRYLGNPVGKILGVEIRNDEYGSRIKSAAKRTAGEYEYRIPVFLEMDLLCTLSAENEPYYYQRYALAAGLDESYNFPGPGYNIYFYVLKIKDADSRRQ